VTSFKFQDNFLESCPIVPTIECPEEIKLILRTKKDMDNFFIPEPIHSQKVKKGKKMPLAQSVS